MTSEIGPKDIVINEKWGKGALDGGGQSREKHGACFHRCWESSLNRECIKKQEPSVAVTV